MPTCPHYLNIEQLNNVGKHNLLILLQSMVIIIHNDYALTPSGRAQVKVAVEKLSGITKIYSSPIRRARESAEMAADASGIAHSNIIYDPRLRELDFGIFQGKPFTEFVEYRNQYMHTLAGTFPEGESYLDAKRRFGSWLYETDTQLLNEKVLVATHGIGIESLVAAAKGLSNADSLAYVRNHIFEYAHMETFKFVPLQVNKDFELVTI